METSNSLDSNRRSSHDCLDDDDGSKEDSGQAEGCGSCLGVPPCFSPSFAEVPSSSSSSSSLMELVSGLMCHCGPENSESVCCCCCWGRSSCCWCSGTSLFCSLTLRRTSWQAFKATSGSITGGRKQAGVRLVATIKSVKAKTLAIAVAKVPQERLVPDEGPD